MKINDLGQKAVLYAECRRRISRLPRDSCHVDVRTYRWRQQGRNNSRAF
jgi:hypothetical protein